MASSEPSATQPSASASSTTSPPPPPPPDGFQLGAAPARRLTLEEYFFTVADLLGVTPDPALFALLPKDSAAEGFSNLVGTQSVSREHPDAFEKLANQLARDMNFDAFLGAHATCQDASDDCRAAFVRSAGKKLFRRPLKEEEVTAFVALHARLQTGESSAAGVDFRRGAQGVLVAFLQSPQFLYRLEDQVVGSVGSRWLTGHEVATRLSYLVWGSAPDDALMNAADSGALADGQGLVVQLERLLTDEKAQRTSRRFVVDWLGLEQMPQQELREEKLLGAVTFFQDHVWGSGQPLLGALTEEAAFLTPGLAMQYGLSPAGEGLTAYDTSGTVNRGGLLTQPGVISAMDRTGHASLVLRGLFLQTRLFCQHAPTPPPDLLNVIAEFEAEVPPGLSKRELSDLRLSKPLCGACHQSFEPLALAFEPFDGYGAYSETDGLGKPQTSDGRIPAGMTAAGQERSYDSIESYMNLLVQEPLVHRCLAQKALEFSLGRVLEANEYQAVESVAAEFVTEQRPLGGAWQDLLRGVIAHPAFTTITTE